MGSYTSFMGHHGAARKAWRRRGLQAGGALLFAASLAACFELVGFGSQTTGGNAYRNRINNVDIPNCPATLPVDAQCHYRVTTTANAGPGSLRYAVNLQRRNIYIDFADGIGTPSNPIVLNEPIRIKGSNVTINAWGDGEIGGTAYGVTIHHHGFVLTGAQNVIIRNVAIRNPSYADDGADIEDGIRITKDGDEVSSHILLQNISVTDFGDSQIDITDSHDITIAYALLGSDDPYYPRSTRKTSDTGTGNKWYDSSDMDHYERTMMINRGYRITLHHNMILGAHIRNPMVKSEVPLPLSPALDMRNNIVSGWGYPANGEGPVLRGYTTANVIGNILSPKSMHHNGAPSLAITVCDDANAHDGRCDSPAYPKAAQAYVNGNILLDAQGQEVINTSLVWHPDDESTPGVSKFNTGFTDAAYDAYGKGACDAFLAGAWHFDPNTGAFTQDRDNAIVTAYAATVRAYCNAKYPPQ